MSVNNDAIKFQKIIENTKDAGPIFGLSMNMLSRITKIMYDSGSLGKTALSRETKISYDRLFKYLDWMEKKYLIEPVLEDHKVKLRLTEKGRHFAVLFCNLEL